MKARLHIIAIIILLSAIVSREGMANESQTWQEQTTILAGKLSDALDKIDPASLKSIFEGKNTLEEINKTLDEKLKSIGNKAFHSKLRIEGESFGNPYVHLEVYIDNPPDITTGKPSKTPINPILKFSPGAAKKPFQVDIPNKYYTIGRHSLDIYVGYPGDNEALVDVKLVPVKRGDSQANIKRYYVHNTSRDNLGPAWPKHRASFDFYLKAK